MGLTLVKKEDGTQGYEYLEEDEDLQVEESTNQFGDALSGIQSGLSEALSADADDNIVEGTLKTAGRFLNNAVVGGVQELSDTARDVGEWTGIAPEGTGTTREEPDKAILGLGEWKPIKADNEQAYLRGVEDFGTGVVQFALEWVTLSKALRGINWAVQTAKLPGAAKIASAGAKLSKLEKGLQTTTAAKTAQVLGGSKAAQFVGRRVTGPLTASAFNATVNPKGVAIDFAGFDQWEGRLFDLAANSEWFGWVENIPLANQLMSNPDDTAMEGRFKNIVEGWGIDFGIGGAWKGLRAPKIDTAKLIIDSVKARGYAEQLKDALETYGKNSPEYIEIAQKIQDLGETIDNNPVVRKAAGEKVPEVKRPEDNYKGIDEAAFDKSMAHLPPEQRARVLAAIRAKQGRSVKELWPFKDIDKVDPQEMQMIRDGNFQLTPQIKQSLTAYRKRAEEGLGWTGEQEALAAIGKEPPKPGKGEFYEVVNGKKRQTAAAKKWNEWNRNRKKTESVTSDMDPALRDEYTQWQELDRQLEALISQEDGTWVSVLDPAFGAAVRADFIEPTSRIDSAVAARSQAFENLLEAQPELGGNVPLKRFETNTARVGLGKGMEGLRGVEYLKKRIRNAKNIQPQDLEDTIAFLELLDESYFKDISFDRVRRTGDKPVMGGKIAADPDKRGGMGRFDFETRVVQVRSDLINDGLLTRTMVHELWHALSRWLPKSDLRKLNKEFLRERKKYLKGLDKVELAYFKAERFTEEAYRYSNIDEYFAETMLDEFWNYLEIRDNLAPRGTLKRISQELGIIFGNIMASVKAKLGISQTKKIFNDYISKKRNKQFRRTVPLGTQIGFDIEDAVARASLDIDIENIKELPNFSKEEGATGPNINKGELERIMRDSVEIANRIEKGEITLEELAQDIVTIDSNRPVSKRIKKGIEGTGEPRKTYFVSDDLSAEILLKAVSMGLERPLATLMPGLRPQEIMNFILADAKKVGMSAETIQILNSPMAELMTKNVSNVYNLLSLKALLHTVSRQAGLKAMNVMNAMNSGEMDFAQAAKELEAATILGVSVFRQYQRITRGLGQQLQSLQAKINVEDLDEIQLKERIANSRESIVIDAQTEARRADLEARAAIDDPNNPANESLARVVPPEVTEALETGNWTPSAQATLNEFAKVVADEAHGSGTGIQAVDKILRGPTEGQKVASWAQKGIEEMDSWDKLHLAGRTLATAKVSSILSAPITWSIQTSVPLTRLLMEPALDVFSHTMTKPSKGSIVPINLKAGLSRLPHAYVWYRQMLFEAIGALRLAKMSFVHGQSYFDAYRHSGAFDLHTGNSVAKMAGETHRGQAVELQTKQGAYNLNELDVAKGIANSNSQQFLNAAWKVATFDIRAQGAIETFQKALAGNSFLYAEGFQEGYQKATQQGITDPQKAWSFAEEYARAKVDNFTHDAIVNGDHVTGAINSHPAAVKLGRMLTFTDDIRARMEPRSIGYGQELARQVGIDPKDFDAINKFAEDYKNGVIDPRREAASQVTDYYQFGRGGERKLPGEGMETPRVTGAWSTIPQVWSALQRQRMGYFATWIQPFVRSPSDITKQALRAMPGLNTTVDTFYRDLFDETSFFQNHWKAEVATGASVAMILTGLTLDDNYQFTGSGPLNAQSRQLWVNSGMRPDSFRKKIKNENGEEIWSEWESYRAYEPIATLLRLAGNIKDIGPNLTWQQRETLQATFAVQIAAMVFGGQLQSTYYEGISDFVDVFMSDGFGRVPIQPGEVGKGQRYIHKQAISFLPMSGRLRSITQMIDPYKRSIPTTNPRLEVDPEIGAGKEGMAWHWGGDDKEAGGEWGYVEKGNFNQLARLATNFINELKRNTPFWSETLPVRRNWITGEPLMNPGFLADDAMPLDDEPWLTRLTGAFVLTHLPIPLSTIPLVGSLPGVVGRKGYSEQGKRDYVMRELMRLRGFGSSFLAPSPDDLQNGVTLSAGAYDQYLQYIALTPDSITGMPLWQALFEIMSSEKYQNFDPDQEGDQYVMSPRTALLTPVIRKYKANGRTLFLRSSDNPYVLEVLEERARQEKRKAILEGSVYYGTPMEDVREGGTRRRVSATEYTQRLNR